ncbi:MAG: hypothetical protein FD130_2181 [Halothiobacillaceae bacterium]|nr:MAG: hypothetical protein FD130_2181 [Halothiobacillaceae bacterium]
MSSQDNITTETVTATAAEGAATQAAELSEDTVAPAVPLLSETLDDRPFTRVEIQWRARTYQTLIFLIKDFRAHPPTFAHLTELPDELPSILRFLAELVKGYQTELMATPGNPYRDPKQNENLVVEGAYVLRRLLLVPGASHYRVLGLPNNAPLDDVTTHYKWLREIYLYDEHLSPQHEGTLRVTEAYVALKNSPLSRRHGRDVRNSTPVTLHHNTTVT